VKKKGEAKYGSQLFNTQSIDRVKIEKLPTASLYLGELLG